MEKQETEILYSQEGKSAQEAIRDAYLLFLGREDAGLEKEKENYV